MYMKVPRSMWRTIVVMLGVLFLPACKAWKPTTVSPRQVILESRPSSIRITDVDGRAWTVRNPMIRNDSIVTSNTDPIGRPTAAAGIPYADVNALEVQRFSPLKTIAFAAGAVAAGTSWARVAGSSSGGSERPEPLPKGFAFSLWDGVRLVAGLIRW
jgi:hypothetical protein